MKEQDKLLYVELPNLVNRIMKMSYDYPLTYEEVKRIASITMTIAYEQIMAESSVLLKLGGNISGDSLRGDILKSIQKLGGKDEWQNAK